MTKKKMNKIIIKKLSKINKKDRLELLNIETVADTVEQPGKNGVETRVIGNYTTIKMYIKKSK